ncbi:DHHC palmitoyltransferase-domain-containing protein [Gongronella butleri]|nr:DHHC palmitoyltransferase-domain-containing protein [Gongronella butleri]
MLETVNGRYIVGCVSVLIGSLALTAQWGVLAPVLGGWGSSWTHKVLLPLNLGLVCLTYYYYLAINTEAGHVPDGWEPPYSIVHGDEPLDVSKGATGPRFCRTCDAYKPPRSHHCRVCQQCVLRMDHHCPWINNCVGHGNYAYFLRFIFSVNLTCSYALALLVWRLYHILDMNSLQNRLHPVTVLEMILIVYDVVGVFIVLFSVGILGLYHIYCLARGQTSIEAGERANVRRLVKKRKIPPVDFPYDVGILANVSSVLGPSIVAWFLPRPSPGDGLTFAIKPNTDPRLVYYWPPRDPDSLRPYMQAEADEQAALAEEERLALISGHGGDTSSSERPVRTPLVRRDSEGYLVREISFAERMQMLDRMYPMVPGDGGNDPAYGDGTESDYGYVDGQYVDDNGYYADQGDYNGGYEEEEEDYQFVQGADVNGDGYMANGYAAHPDDLDAMHHDHPELPGDDAAFDYEQEYQQHIDYYDSGSDSDAKYVDDD